VIYDGLDSWRFESSTWKRRTLEGEFERSVAVWWTVVQLWSVLVEELFAQDVNILSIHGVFCIVRTCCYIVLLIKNCILSFVFVR
jgi:hypothetical protein